MRSWERRLAQFDRDLETEPQRIADFYAVARDADRAGRARLPLAGHELTMAKLDPEIQAHLEWLGFVQPTGLVVSAPALVRAGAILDRNDAAGQRLLRLRRGRSTAGRPSPSSSTSSASPAACSAGAFSPKGYAGIDGRADPAGARGRPARLRRDPAARPTPSASATRPTARRPGSCSCGCSARTLDFDDAGARRRPARGLRARADGAAAARDRRPGRPAVQRPRLRLISAPRGESSGWLDVPRRRRWSRPRAGRSSRRCGCSCGQQRLLTLPREQRLPALLADSRKFQNEVSTKLAEQVLDALYELLRGFQAADDAADGELLREPLAERPGPGLPRRC